MSKAELLEVVGEALGRRPDDGRAIGARRGLALLTLRGGTPENTLALETLEALADGRRGAGGRRRRCG